VPDGHVPIHRFLGVPVVAGDQLLGIIAVANANREYQVQDQDTLGRVADLYAVAIQQFRAADLLKKRTQELIRSNQELEEFAYVASHDLQEPLRKIRSFTELLQKQLYVNIDERSRKYMDYVVDAAQRMQLLINDLLEYSRLGRLEITYKSVDMEACLTN
jgi:light-regulated signal transduction histidine kinase (bacteriophytochrome)